MAPQEVGAFRYGKSVLGQEWGVVQMWEGLPENEVGRAPAFDGCSMSLTLRNELDKSEEIHAQ